MRGQDLIIWVLLYLEGYRPDFTSKYSIISRREEYNSLNRLTECGLVKKKNWKGYEADEQRFLHFMKEAIPYLFPLSLPKGEAVEVPGISTIHPALGNSLIGNTQSYVWPMEGGGATGLAVKPIHKGCLVIAQHHRKAYTLLSLIDGARLVGNPRTKEMAIAKVAEIFGQHQPPS